MKRSELSRGLLSGNSNSSRRHHGGIVTNFICAIYRNKLWVMLLAAAGCIVCARHFYKNENNTGTLSEILERGEHAVASVSAPVTKLVSNIRGSTGVWKNKYDLVHVVETDFLQYQVDLVHMNAARLEIFKTFTVPSLQQQTNKEFLWLIWTDPKLSDKLKDELVDLVKDVPNAVVLGFRREARLDFRDFNGLLERDLDEVIVEGSRKLLESYHAAAQDRLLLETRLDADDALHKNFVESIQHQASKTIAKGRTKDYRIFCAEHHTEWRYYQPNDPDVETEDGHLVHYSNPSFCINSGLTIGYQTQAKTRHLQTREQCNMNQQYELCDAYDKEQQQCINRVEIVNVGSTLDESEVAAIQNMAIVMSRTPTTAGMKHVLGTERSYKDSFESVQSQKDAWRMVRDDFGVDQDNVRRLRRSMEANMVRILQDALNGQCMPGHSCKESTKNKLLKLLEKAQEKAKQKK